MAHVFTLAAAANTKGASVNFASNVHDVYRNVMLNSLPITCICKRLLTALTNTSIIFLYLIIFVHIYQHKQIIISYQSFQSTVGVKISRHKYDYSDKCGCACMSNANNHAPLSLKRNALAQHNQQGIITSEGQDIIGGFS